MAAHTPQRSTSRSHRSASGRTRRRRRNGSQQTRRQTSRARSHSTGKKRRRPARGRARHAAAAESSTTIMIRVTPSVREQWRRLSARWKELLPKLRNGESLKQSLARMRRVARSTAFDVETPAVVTSIAGRSDERPKERRPRVSIKYPG